MLLPEELYPHIPKLIKNWTSHDVKLWLTLNRIEHNYNFDDINFNGIKLFTVSYEQLTLQCGIGKIVARKVLEWLEHDLQQFQEYVSEQQSATIEPDRLSKIDISETEVKEEKENNAAIQNQRECSKHACSIINAQSVQKWNKKRPSHPGAIQKSKNKSTSEKQCDKPPSNSPQLPMEQSVKLAQSNYQICQSQLEIQINLTVKIINHSARIGRNPIHCDIVVIDDSVSRQHAQILKKDGNYFIRDIGSKFGTYLQIGCDKQRQLKVGDVLAFVDYYIDILKIKINKNGTVDLKLNRIAEKETVINFYGKRQITIGRTGNDIAFNDKRISNSHASIIVDNGQLYLVKKQGLSFIKLENQQFYEIEGEVLARFGMEIVKMECVRIYKPIIIGEFDQNQYKLL